VSVIPPRVFCFLQSSFGKDTLRAVQRDSNAGTDVSDSPLGPHPKKAVLTVQPVTKRNKSSSPLE
jgi:hypothetical protein